MPDLHILATFGGQQTGDAWEIVVMQSGEIKGRDQYVGAEALQASLDAFDRVWVQKLVFSGDFKDHLPEDARAMFPNGLVSGNVVGLADSPRFERSGDGGAIVATFRPADDTIRQLLLQAQQAGKLDGFGLSINAGAAPDHVRPMSTPDGRRISEITQIDHVDSIDFVTYPGAGGYVRALLASRASGRQPAAANTGDTTMTIKDQLKALLEQRGVSYTDDASPLNILASVPVQAAGDVGKLLESLKKALESGLDGVAAQLLAMALDKPAPDTPDDDAPDDGPDNSDDDEKKKPVAASDPTAEARQKTHELDLMYSRALVRETLASADGLPDDVKTILASQYDGRIVTRDQIEADLARQRKILAAADPDAGKPRPGRNGLMPGLDTRDKAQIAMHKMLGVQASDAEKSAWAGVDAFRGIRTAYHALTGDGERVTGRVLASAFESTNFPELLGDSMHRRLLQEYRDAAPMAMSLVSAETSITDFRDNYVIQFGGLEDLTAVTETGGYGEAAEPSDTQASYGVSTYGKHIRLSRVFIKNDSLNALQRVVRKINRAAKRTLNKYIFDLLLNYSGSINGGTIYDGAALYTSGGAHSNMQTDALGYNALWSLRNLINAQAEADSSEPLDLEPGWLIVPKELEKTALELLSSEGRPGDITNDINVFRMRQMQLMVVDKTYLRSDANNYYCMADPKDAEGIVMGFMDGQVEPELFLQDGPTEGNVFAYDHITYKVRHEYGGCVVDYRPFAASIVA